MSFQIKSAPTIQEITLDHLDPEQPEERIVVGFRQATTGDELRVESLFSKQRQVWSDAKIGEVALERDWNFRELKRYRCYRCMTSCNLIDENGNPYFSFTTDSPPKVKQQQSEFFDAWDALPSFLTELIYEAYLIVNPQHNPGLQGE